MAEKRTPQELRFERLAGQADFIELLVEWHDSVQPWSGPVSTNDAAQASWVNGRASFVNDMLEDMRRYLPECYERFERTRSKYVRTQLDRELREGSPRSERQRRLDQYDEPDGADA